MTDRSPGRVWVWCVMISPVKCLLPAVKRGSLVTAISSLFTGAAIRARDSDQSESIKIHSLHHTYSSFSWSNKKSQACNNVSNVGEAIAGDRRHSHIRKYYRGVPGWRQLTSSICHKRKLQHLCSQLHPLLSSGLHQSSGSDPTRILPSHIWLSNLLPRYSAQHNSDVKLSKVRIKWM